MDICDFHSHIMPATDHGCMSVDEAIAQLKLAKRYGITRVVSTSHFYPHKDTVESFIEKRNGAYAAIAERDIDGLPQIRLGAEVLLCANMDELPDLDKLCINGTRTILVELPFNDFGSEYVRAIEGMVLQGYEVILAHAECYDAKNVEKVLSVGALIQVNASAFASVFGRKKVLKSWMHRRKIVALGSDVHGVDKRSYRNFRRACRRLVDYAEYIQKKSDAIWSKSIPLPCWLRKIS